MEFETRYKAFEIQDMKFVTVSTARVRSLWRDGVSDSDMAPRQGEKKFEPEKMGTLLGAGVAGLPVPMIDALEDGVVVVVYPAVDIYSADEIEGTPA
jgi:hypothetical protein